MNKQGSAKFKYIKEVNVKFSKSKAIIGGSFVALPEKIKAKKAFVNIVNKDKKCFLWSLIASNHYKDIKRIEVSYYKKIFDFANKNAIIMGL